MISYIEKKYRQQSTYIKIISNETGKITSQRSVTCPLYQVKNNGSTYFMLYDDNMNIIHPAYTFLNVSMAKNSYNTRKSAAHALRLLYCFLSLTLYDIHELRQKEIDELKNFLRGIGVNSDKYNMQTIRSGKTINEYLAIYRTFFRQHQIQCKALFDSKTARIDINLGDYASKTTRKKYQNNVIVSTSDDNKVPKYISPKDFAKIYRAAAKSNDHTSMLIMHLMYGYGLRLGEALGLTIEDIKEVTRDNALIPVLFIRNRISDRDFQFAKNKMHPISYDQQKKDKIFRDSVDKIQITYDLYDDLVSYVNEYHELMMIKYPQNYETTKADILSYRDAPEENHYVFLSRYGRVLTDQTFGNILKKYYTAAGIALDYGIREDNLAHRLRHGFAMFHSRFSSHPVDVLQLQKMMRHKSVTSTMIYYNPTDDDKLETQKQFEEDLLAAIPELMKGRNVGVNLEK